jgi:hypothetical protein
MRHIAISSFLAAAIAAPASAQLVITGKVTAGANLPIEGATVYVNDLGLMAYSTADGSYQLAVPSQYTKGQLMNLRLRVLGYAPIARVITLGAGRQTVNFTAERDTVGSPGFRERIATEMAGARMSTKATGPSYAASATRATGPQGADPARVPSGARAVAIPDGVGADPFNRYLFQPETVMRYQDALGLTEEQRTKLQAAMEDAQKRAIQVQWALAAENEKLQKALDKTVVDEKETVGAMDRIVGVEREMKRAQLELLVKIKNTLSQDQQERLRKLRGFDN